MEFFQNIIARFFTDFGVIIISALIFVVSFLWKDILTDIQELYFRDDQKSWVRVAHIFVISSVILIFVLFLRVLFEWDAWETMSRTFVEDLVGIIISALIFIVLFLWKDVLTDIQELYFPRVQGLRRRLLYTFAVTAMILLFIIFLRRLLRLHSNQIRFDASPESGNIVSPVNLEISE